MKCHSSDTNITHFNQHITDHNFGGVGWIVVTIICLFACHNGKNSETVCRNNGENQRRKYFASIKEFSDETKSQKIIVWCNREERKEKKKEGERTERTTNNTNNQQRNKPEEIFCTSTPSGSPSSSSPPKTLSNPNPIDPLPKVKVNLSP